MADKNFLTEIIDADLAEGKISEIHTRFPPEPNGYLHIGSAKAIYINWSIANQYGGRFNLRLDDTNPAREGEEYVNSIIEDLHWLGADPNGGIFYGSDYFDKCYEYAEKLILEGKAYVDDLTRDEMRKTEESQVGQSRQHLLCLPEWKTVCLLLFYFRLTGLPSNIQQAPKDHLPYL